MSFKIGNVKIKNNLVLAPMAGINDIPFRLLCKENGVGLLYTEMVNANAVVRNNKSTLRLAKTLEIEKPIAIQIFASKKDIIAEAAKILEPNASIIDFNLGCPAPKIVNTGAGAALLAKPKKVQEILEKLVGSVNVPVTVKIRLGFGKINALQISKIAESAGVSAVAVHARTYAQGYSGKADLNYIKEIKENISIPVIGNGDVNDSDSFKKMLAVSDAVMIGRAAKNNPAIFEEFLSGKVANKKELFLRYCELAKEHNCEEFKTALIHSLNFSSSLKNSRALRRKLSGCKTIEQLKECFL